MDIENEIKQYQSVIENIYRMNHTKEYYLNLIDYYAGKIIDLQMKLKVKND